MEKGEAEREIRDCLEANERLLWSGVPIQGFALHRSDAFYIPFSVIIAGIFVFVLVIAATSSQEVPAPILILLLLVALYLVLGRFPIDKAVRESTAYGLTDRRVIIVSRFPFRRVRTLSLKKVTDLTLEETANGRGTITFGVRPSRIAMSFGPFAPGAPGRQIPSFAHIPSARDAYWRVCEAQDAVR